MSTTFLNSTDLDSLEKRKRVALINSISGFKAVSLIGTADSEKNNNLSIFSSIFHLGANPALLGLIVRHDDAYRHTLQNILDTRYYTVNHINKTIYKRAHQTSARYEKNVSEFDAVGLTSIYKNDFFAPFVQESNIQLGLEFKERIDLTINNTVLIIGEIRQIYMPSDCMCEDGFVDLEKADSITCSGLDSYHVTKRLSRLSYAKPNVELHELSMKFST